MQLGWPLLKNYMQQVNSPSADAAGAQNAGGNAGAEDVQDADFEEVK